MTFDDIEKYKETRRLKEKAKSAKKDVYFNTIKQRQWIGSILEEEVSADTELRKEYFDMFYYYLAPIFEKSRIWKRKKLKSKRDIGQDPVVSEKNSLLKQIRQIEQKKEADINNDERKTLKALKEILKNIEFFIESKNHSENDSENFLDERLEKTGSRQIFNNLVKIETNRKNNISNNDWETAEEYDFLLGDYVGLFWSRRMDYFRNKNKYPAGDPWESEIERLEKRKSDLNNESKEYTAQWNVIDSLLYLIKSDDRYG